MKLMNKKRTILLFFFLALHPVISYSQQIVLGSWNILNIKYNYNDKLSLFGEAQLRSLRFYNNFHYYEYKGGINYKVHKNVKLTL